MPPAWKVMAYATVVLLLFAVAATTWAQSADPVTLTVMFLSLFATVAIGYYIGNSVVSGSDRE